MSRPATDLLHDQIRYIIMSRMALQLLEEWLGCMQHDSSGMSVVASSSF